VRHSSTAGGYSPVLQVHKRVILTQGMVEPGGDLALLRRELQGVYTQLSNAQDEIKAMTTMQLELQVQHLQLTCCCTPDDPPMLQRP
jgi:hypothetical protein